jgi:uncharacterized oxidoreductase
MTAARSNKKMTPENLVKALVDGLKKNQLTIRVGDTKLVYVVNRLSPKTAFGLVNLKKDTKKLLPQKPAK